MLSTQTNIITELTESTSLDVLRCPHCQSDDVLQDPSFVICQSCEKNFPKLSFGKVKIPFLFSDVSVAMHDWCARKNGFNAKISEEIKLLSENIADKTASKITRERIKKILNAKKHYQTQVLEHLNCFQEHPLNNAAINTTEVAKNQGINSYINNIFRDWCWNNGENEQLLSAIYDVLENNYQAGLCVTLGAGAGKFSYDFHQAYSAEHSVLIDINPMLLGIANRVLSGEKIILNEFPIAPLSSDNFCVRQELNNADNSYDNEFTFLLADGLNAPVKSNYFDSVLTPWFIDIIPVDFKEFIPHVNRLLKVGGSWINTGSLAFFHKQEQWNYSAEEIRDLLGKFGFGDIRISRKKINYLHSPHSAHGRVENVFSFSAKKKFDCIKPKQMTYLPDWITNTNLTIPQQAHIIVSSSKYLLQAQVLSAIDGQRSITEIGSLLAKQYDMSLEHAVAAVRQILIDNL